MGSDRFPAGKDSVQIRHNLEAAACPAVTGMTLFNSTPSQLQLFPTRQKLQGITCLQVQEVMEPHAHSSSIVFPHCDSCNLGIFLDYNVSICSSSVRKIKHNLYTDNQLGKK